MPSAIVVSHQRLPHVGEYSMSSKKQINKKSQHAQFQSNIVDGGHRYYGNSITGKSGVTGSVIVQKSGI